MLLTNVGTWDPDSLGVPDPDTGTLTDAFPSVADASGHCGRADSPTTVVADIPVLPPELTSSASALSEIMAAAHRLTE